jgi:hypothetical protein
VNTVPDQLDWSELLAQAQKRHLVLAVRDMLRDLHDILDAPISMVLQQVDATPVSALELREHRIRIRPRRLMGGFPLLWFRYERALLSSGRSRRWSDLWGFVRFMQYRWAVDHLWKLPFLLAGKALLAIKAAVRRRWSTGLP